MTDETPSPLTGKALLQKIKELEHLTRREKARKCGYYSITKDNTVRVNLGEFLNAIIEANGLVLNPEPGKDGRGREANYRVSVHKNGQIVIGSTYTQAMSLSPGDEFEIKLGYKHIHLIQVDPEDAKEMARRAAREEGMLVGISSGATLAAIAQKLTELDAGSRVLGFNYDTGERYLSVPDFLPVE